MLKVKIYNKMHYENIHKDLNKNINSNTKDSNNNDFKRSDNSILNSNKNIKYIMYKNRNKNISKSDLLFDNNLNGPKSSRTKSLHAVIKYDYNYNKFKNHEQNLFQKILSISEKNKLSNIL